MPAIGSGHLDLAALVPRCGRLRALRCLSASEAIEENGKKDANEEARERGHRDVNQDARPHRTLARDRPVKDLNHGHVLRLHEASLLRLLSQQGDQGLLDFQIARQSSELEPNLGHFGER